MLALSELLGIDLPRLIGGTRDTFSLASLFHGVGADCIAPACLEAGFGGSAGWLELVLSSVVQFLGCCWSEVVDCSVGALVVEEVDPVQGL